MLTNQDIKRAGKLLARIYRGFRRRTVHPRSDGENVIVGLIQLRKFLEQSLKKVYERKYGKRAVTMEGDTVRLSESGNLPDVPWDQNTSPDPSVKPPA